MARRVALSVLLDTCALLALARGELSRAAAAALRDATEASVSTISPWEVGIKAARGKIILAEPVLRWFAMLAERHNLLELPLEARTACAAAALPPIHQDPFDRVIVALARERGAVVLTSDRDIARYPGVDVLW